MSTPGSINELLIGAAGAAGGGYEIERSLRFNSSDSAYLSRTPASAGNRRTYTYSTWVKRAALGGGTYYLFTAVDGGNVDIIGFEVDRFYWYNSFSGSVNSQNLYRDPSAWYHVLASVDSTQAIGTDRVKLYVNGAEVAYAAALYPSLNRDFAVNNTVAHKVGQYFTTNSSNFYLADVHFIDGQALDPTSFGEFDTNGVWQPIAYAGSYGTNGFYLAFSDNSTAAALGTDTSGNGNTWTVNNLSVAAGADNDSLVDSPTNGSQEDTGVGGEVRGNYCTINPLQSSNAATVTANGNLDVTIASNSSIRSTFYVSTGKWYYEVTVNTLANLYLGLAGNGGNPASFTTNDAFGINNGGNFFENDALQTEDSIALAAGSVYGIAFDADAQLFWISKNGQWYSCDRTPDVPITVADVIAGTFGYDFSTLAGSSYTPHFGNSTTAGANVSANFGQRPFAYTAPSGFKALCTTNLEPPTIDDGSTAMDVVLYTGNGLARDITGYNFSPDLVWIKSRSAATDHGLYDIVRGVQKNLTSNNNAQELDYSPNYLSAFNSDGFSIGGAGAYVNTNTSTYVAWAWDAGSSTVPNNDGSITSQVRANASAGFSVVTYTGNGTAGATVGHGLGVAPSMLLVRSRVGDNWAVYHSSIGATKYLILNATSAEAVTIGRWNNTAPTSTVVSIGDHGSVNTDTTNYVAYCFAPVAGYSSFGSYTGNGSADGPFVYTAMRPRWILLKRADSTSNWTILDTAREGYNVDNDPLYPNLANAEGTTDLADILSNGFKLRTTDASVNASAGTYVYACFSEHPFATSRAR